MDSKPNEPIPTSLLALALGALSLSGVALICGGRCAPPTGPGSQSAAPDVAIRWSLSDLPPVELSDLQTGPTGPGWSEWLASTDELLRIDPPEVGEPLGLLTEDNLMWRLTAVELEAAAPSPPRTKKPAPTTRASIMRAPRLEEAVVLPWQVVTDPNDYRDRLVILMPRTASGEVGRLARRVPSREDRRRWSVFGADTLALAERAGRAAVRLSTGRREDVRAEGHPMLISARGAKMPPPASDPPVAVPSERSEAVAVKASIVRYLSVCNPNSDFAPPIALGRQLDEVAQSREAAAWAWAAAYRLRRLTNTPAADTEAVRRSLAALEKTAASAASKADAASQPSLASRLRRVGHGLERRVATWRGAHSQGLAIARAPASRLEGARWAMSRVGLGLAPGSMLADSERTVADEPLDIAKRLERYELAPGAEAAREIVAEAARMAQAPGADQGVPDAVERGYRNANVRLAVSDELLERLLPSPEPRVTRVNDRVAGTRVRGRATTKTELSIKLTPDPNAWRLAIEARGDVASQTYSRGGPAILKSRSHATFQATKPVVVDATGWSDSPAQATVRASSRLVGVSSSYDRLPLVNSYIRSTARKEYLRRRRRASAEMTNKVERRVSDTLDRQVGPEVAKIEQRLRDDLLDRANALGLSIDPIEMRTTGERLIGRVRVASDQQLAAHTPRMRAPSDSCLSFQLHESTFNNTIEVLDLAGRRMTTKQLRQKIADSLAIKLDADAASNERAVVRFADKEPVRIAFEEGRARLTLSVAELSVRGGKHRNFRVHTLYKPVAEGLEAYLVQDGTPQIEGRMRAGSRMRLHGVLGKVLGENRRIPVVRHNQQEPTRVAKALEGMATNQLVLEDGWLGVSIGPKRDQRIATQVGRYPK